MNYNDLKKRYIGLDVLRIVSAVVICLFHTNIHLNCNYGILQPMITMGAVFMTAFFMLSGFCLFVNYSGKKLSNFTITKGFYLKRFIGIMPMYYIVALFYVIVQFITKT